jgi:cell division protease FtsH
MKCATMGGRAAVTFNRISTGALSDLEKSNQQANNGYRLLNEKLKRNVL